MLATVAMVAIAFLAPAGLPRIGIITSASVLVALLGVFVILWWRIDLSDRVEETSLANFISEDVLPSFITDEDGVVLFTNRAARVRCDGRVSDTLGGTLKQIFANPSPILNRLQGAVSDAGAAREEIVTRKGHVRLSVHRMSDNRLVWRLEDLQEKAVATRSAAPQLPMLMLGRNDAILSMNEAARALIGRRVKSLDRVLLDPNMRQGVPTDISTDTGRVTVTPCEIDAGAGRRALYFLPIDNPQHTEGWQAIEELPVPLLRVSPSGDVLTYNSSAKFLLGDELRSGVLLSDLMEGLGRSIRDWLRDTLDRRAGQNSEFLRLRRADKEVFVQVTLTPVDTADGPALIAVLNDATELKTLEAQFVQSQKMQAIGQLAGGVAHDFNNLLTAISGHCDLLLLRHDQGDPDYADLVQINQNANRAAALVSQLLAFSRKQTLRPKTIDMRDTLADLTHLLNRLVGERVSLHTSYDPVLPPIRADKRQLEQVLMNLVVNARDAMPEGGQIRVTCEYAELSEPMVRDNATVAAGTYVCVTVSDEGIGIPPDKLQKVFEPFYTTKRTDEGTGLGLSTAYGIVKQTGGFIFVDSIVGKGTTFTIYLPAQDAQEETVEADVVAVEQKVTPAHAEGVILLVEDEAPVRAFASRALRMRGYTVLEADSAEAALETLSDPSLSIDVFVTDVVMPGMDGPSWVQQALKERPDTRVVFVSGYAEDSFGETQSRIPNSVFLPKPFSLTDLAETVHRQLH
ncbi:ATP-binding response regulator [Aliishimia ponticola]|nr:ATP-binding protein [Aliishimia ponticola]